MKVKRTHWTASSIKNFVYRVASDFVLQIEKRMDKENINQKELAERVELSEGRVSQILNNPGNLTLKKMVEFARGLGMKLAVVAYDDADPENVNGPINSEIFQLCWERSGSPTDFFDVSETTQVMNYTNVIQTSNVQISEGMYWIGDWPQHLNLSPTEVGEQSSSNRDTHIFDLTIGQDTATGSAVHI